MSSFKLCVMTASIELNIHSSIPVPTMQGLLWMQKLRSSLLSHPELLEVLSSLWCHPVLLEVLFSVGSPRTVRGSVLSGVTQSCQRFVLSVESPRAVTGSVLCCVTLSCQKFCPLSLESPRAVRGSVLYVESP